jgi:hypothetical protein
MRAPFSMLAFHHVWGSVVAWRWPVDVIGVKVGAVMLLLI